jgi:hypothetical protein
MPLQVWDAPDVNDTELYLAEIVSDIKSSIGSDTPFDAAIVVMKAQFDRATA